jgi:hypothetical protein
MTGIAEVRRLSNALDATFLRVTKLPTDAEVQSDFARYLCILVSGFLENAVAELLIEHTRQRAGPSVLRFIDSEARRITNVNAQRLKSLLARFDDDWLKEFDSFLVDERKDAVDSIVALRNSIAHGQSVGVTLVRVKRYYEQVKLVVERLATLCTS